MGIQQSKVDLSGVLKEAAVIRAIRLLQEEQINTLKHNLLLRTRAEVVKGRTDFITHQEVAAAIRKVLSEGGFATDRNTIDTYA